MSRAHQSLIDMFDALPKREQALLLEDLKHRVQSQTKKSIRDFLPIQKGEVVSNAQDRVMELRREWEI